jgi:hypothetical protein
MCPCEDPTLDITAAVGVAYKALVDQHMVPLQRMEDSMSDLLPWDSLLSVRHLGRPTNVALPLSSSYLPSATSCPFPTSEETLDASLLVGSLKRPPNVCTCLVEDQKLAWL